MVQKINVLLLLVIGIFLISFTSATYQFEDSLGTYKQGTDINLYQVCNCTYSNITNVLYPNGSIIISNQIMNRSGTYFNFSLSKTFTQTLGTYTVNGIGDLDGLAQPYSYSFVINTIGEELTLAKSIVYFGSLLVIVFLFIVNVITIPLLPSTDKKNPDGEVMELEPLKYGRMLLYLTAYAFLTAIMFISSNIASAFLQTTLLANILFMGFRFLMWGAIIGVPIWILRILDLITDVPATSMSDPSV